MPPALDLFRVDGRVALVTGASRGLGAAMASALADAGADVALHASSQPAADTAGLHRAHERPAHGAADGRSRPPPNPPSGWSPKPWSASAASTSSSTTPASSAASRRPSHGDAFWDEVLAVNLSSVFRLSRAAGRHMLERGEGGKIVNIASLLSFQGGITVPGYAAAKGGVMQLTKALANEWAPPSHQRQRHRAGLHGDRQHRRAPKRSGPQPPDRRAHPRWTLGHAPRSRRRRRLPGFPRLRLRARARARRRWRLDGALKDRMAITTTLTPARPADDGHVVRRRRSSRASSVRRR